MLKGKTVVLGVTGCIAAYKACEIVSSLKKKGATVIVIMTPHSTEFVQPLSFETLSGNRVITDLFDRDFDFEVEHVALAKRADVFVVAPATANTIGKSQTALRTICSRRRLWRAKRPKSSVPR